MFLRRKIKVQSEIMYSNSLTQKCGSICILQKNIQKYTGSVTNVSVWFVVIASSDFCIFKGFTLVFISCKRKYIYSLCRLIFFYCTGEQTYHTMGHMSLSFSPSVCVSLSLSHCFHSVHHLFSLTLCFCSPFS